jgi:geranylgeranyl diphosphate synthase type I
MASKKSERTPERLLEILKERNEKGIEQASRIILAEKTGSKKMQDALEYYTSDWKIFTHPALLSIACEAVGGNPDKAVEVQAATTMLTSALDIHDDVIDRSDIKHGKPTVFGKFGHDIALLLGNAFLVSGFTVLEKSVARLPNEKRGEIFETLRRSLFEIGNAHVLELDFKGKMDISPDEYMRILRMKAASVEADMRIGAIIGGGTDRQIEALTEYGRILGLLATLREEFVDIFEIQELRQRVKNECLPIPILYALTDQNPQEIKRILSKKRITEKDVNELLDAVFKKQEVRKLKQTMRELISNGLSTVSAIRDKNMKQLLSDLVTSTLQDLQPCP